MGASREHPHLAIDAVRERLAALDLDELRRSGEWGTSRTSGHLAQSVEFSMSGFPVHKSRLFRSTAGPIAPALFQARGHISHGLDEVIPGEVVLSENDATPKQALRRLQAALDRFESFDEPLQPHFSYGELDKSRYAAAHAMHIDDHLGVLAGA